MLRIIFAGLFVGLFLICSIPLLLVLWIVGKFNEKAKLQCSYRIIQWAFRVVLFICGTKLDVYGEENLPKEGGALYVGNHRSIFDILIIFVTVKCPSGIISKKEINKVPLLNSWMNNIGCLFLDRDNIKEGLKMVLEAVNRVKNGLGIIIFPEGTRSKEEGVFLPFKGGSFKIAEKSGCDVIPFSIVNAAAIFEDHKPFIKKSHVILTIGEPIVTKDLDKEHMKKIPEIARNKVIEMHNEKAPLCKR